MNRLPNQVGPRRVAITGGCGNLGRKIATALESEPWCDEIVLIDRIRAPEAGKIRSAVADLCDMGDTRWVDVVSRMDAIVHLAADNPNPDCTWPEACRSLDMTANLAAVASRRTSRVVFASSNHVMGGYKEAEPGPGTLTTQLPPDPGTRFYSGGAWRRDVAYATSKLMGERVVAAAAAASGGLMTAVSLRVGWCQPGANLPSSLTGEGISSDSVPDTAYEGHARDLLWFRSMWLSNRDMVDAVTSALCADSAGWGRPAIVVNAMSANRGMPWDIAAGARLIGYTPRDDVWAHL